jgi:hypothetical protein
VIVLCFIGPFTAAASHLVFYWSFRLTIRGYIDSGISTLLLRGLCFVSQQNFFSLHSEGKTEKEKKRKEKKLNFADL